MIRAAIFDLENTLVRNSYLSITEKATAEAISKVLELPPKVALELFKVCKKLYPSSTATIQAMGVPKELFHAYLGKVEFKDRLRTPPMTKTAIVQLKRNNIKIGLLTNAPLDLCLKILAAAKIDSANFDSIVTGDQVKETKPSIEPFAKILNNLQLPSKKAIMVGDRPKVDLKPAKKLGMYTFLVSPVFNKNKLPEDVDAKSSNMIEVVHFIKAVNRRSNKTLNSA